MQLIATHTSSVEIAFMQKFSFGQYSRRQVSHSTLCLKITLCSPCGHHIPGKSRAENIDTQGVPTAAAMCWTPESTHTKNSQRSSKAQDSSREHRPAIFATFVPIAFSILPQASRSASPATITTPKPNQT